MNDMEFWIYIGTHYHSDGTKSFILEGPEFGPEKIWLARQSDLLKAISYQDTLKAKLEKAEAALKNIRNRLSTRNIQIYKDEAELMIGWVREALREIRK